VVGVVAAPVLHVVLDVEVCWDLWFRRCQLDALLEVPQEIGPAPCVIGAGQFAPNVIVFGGSALEYHAVDGGTAADDTTYVHRKRPVSELRRWSRGDVV
jgi:hypothetical protein